MKLHTLHPAEGSRKSRNRVGRGQGSENGKTSGRGQKGQKARSGGSINPVFEGGQLPLYRRLPKRGFTNRFAKEYAEINVADLNRFEAGAVVDFEALSTAGLVKQVKDGVKVLGNGELEKALTVKAVKFSKGAVEKIEKAGGKAEVL